MSGHWAFVAKDERTDEDVASTQNRSWFCDQRADTGPDSPSTDELLPDDDHEAPKEWRLDEIECVYLQFPPQGRFLVENDDTESPIYIEAFWSSMAGCFEITK